MNSDETSLKTAAAKWQELPGAEAVERAAKQLCEEYRPASRSTREFNRLVSRVTHTLANAGNRSVPKGPEALGLGVSWLTLMGGLDEFHFAFAEGEPDAPKHVIIALRDALLGQLQQDHRRHLLTTCFPDWASRQKLADEWREGQPPEVGARHEGWELTDCIEEMLDSVGASQRLLKQLGHVSTPHSPINGDLDQETSTQKAP